MVYFSAHIDIGGAPWYTKVFRYDTIRTWTCMLHFVVTLHLTEFIYAFVLPLQNRCRWSCGPFLSPSGSSRTTRTLFRLVQCIRCCHLCPRLAQLETTWTVLLQVIMWPLFYVPNIVPPFSSLLQRACERTLSMLRFCRISEQTGGDKRYWSEPELWLEGM
jgi:hypothetical protein